METMESKPDDEIPTTLKTIKMKIFDIPVPVFKCHHISTTSLSPSVSAMPSTSSAMSPTSSTTSTQIVVVPELAIPADAYPKHLNRPGIGKDYLCQLCHFTFQFRFDFNSC